MSSLNLIKELFRESFRKIRKFWHIIIILLLIQGAFFYSINSIGFFYLVKIMDNSQSVLDEIASKDLSDENLALSLAKQQEIIDPYAISEKAKQLFNDFFAMMFLILSAIIIFEGVLWALSDNLFSRKDFRKTLSYLGKFALYAISVFLIAFIVFILVSSALFADISGGMPPFEGLIALVAAIFFVSIYFLVLACSAIPHTTLKEVFRKISFMGFNKFLVTMPLYLIICAMIALTGGLIVVFANLNIILLFVSMVLFLSVFVFARILFISAAEELEKEFTRHPLHHQKK